MKIAIIGGGIVGAFANKAIVDTFRQVNEDIYGQPMVDVFTLDGTRKDPPPGAFYLHELPGDIKGYMGVRNHQELLIGNDLDYYGKLQGLPYMTPTSVHRMPSHRTLGVYYPTPALLSELWEGANFMSGQFHTQKDVLDLVCFFGYDYVICTVNIPMDGMIAHPAPVVKHHVAILGGSVGRKTIERLFPHMPEKMLLECVGIRGSKHDSSTYHNCSGQDQWIRATFGRAVGKDFGHIEISDSMAKSPAMQSPGILTVAVSKIGRDYGLHNRSSSDDVLLTGRWATWKVKELSHETYFTVQKALIERFG